MIQILSMSQVTPAFQKFVASKLDELLELEDVEVVEENSVDSNVQKTAGVKLTKRSRADVKPEETDMCFKVQRKPSLLAHRKPQVRSSTIVLSKNQPGKQLR